AMIASEDNRPAEARQALAKGLDLNPKFAMALRDLGELELHAGEYAKAARHLKGAMEVRPDDAGAAFYEGEALEKIHDLNGARDALEVSLKLLPGQLPGRLLLGQVYLALKDPKAAEDQFEAALLLQSNSVEAKVGVASAQIAEGRFDEALRQLEPLSRTQPNVPEIFELLAQVYSRLGKTAAAEQATSKAERLRGKK